MHKLSSDRCGNCDANLRGGPIPVELRRSYGGKTHYSRLIGVEYPHDVREHYDGISEWNCPDCGYREGRWSGRALGPGEREPRWGGEEIDDPSTQTPDSDG